MSYGVLRSVAEAGCAGCEAQADKCCREPSVVLEWIEGGVYPQRLPCPDDRCMGSFIGGRLAATSSHVQTTLSDNHTMLLSSNTAVSLVNSLSR